MMSPISQMKAPEHAPFPKLSSTQVEKTLLPQLNQWALSNGLIMADKTSGSTAKVAPTTVFPTPVPAKVFEQAKNLQKTFNQLYAQVSNSEWLMEETEKLVHSDPDFTGKLYAMAKKSASKQTLKMGLFRSDYLIDQHSEEIKQVEFNTVSVSFAGLSSKVGEMHSFLNSLGAYDASGEMKMFYEGMGELPVSESSVFMTRGLARGFTMYQSVNSETKKEKAVVAFIVEPNETNLYDQKAIEFNLLRLYGIRSIRLTFEEALQDVEYSSFDDNKRMFQKKTGKELAVVYYRTGYTTGDYYSDDCWKAREFLENGYAIKAPTLDVQLAGAKKVQQLLTQDDVLSKFVDDEEAKQKLAKTFVKIYPLDDSPLGQEGKKLALQGEASKKQYVLKPQREGGGNNVYKSDIPKFLKSLDEKDWDSYILMELIDVKPSTENYLVRDGKLSREPVVSELGIYGTILFDAESIRSNEYAGSLLRTKPSSSNEGGVVAGFGTVDSMCLV